VGYADGRPERPTAGRKEQRPGARRRRGAPREGPAGEGGGRCAAFDAGRFHRPPPPASTINGLLQGPSAATAMQGSKLSSGRPAVEHCGPPGGRPAGSERGGTPAAPAVLFSVEGN